MRVLNCIPKVRQKGLAIAKICRNPPGLYQVYKYEVSVFSLNKTLIFFGKIETHFIRSIGHRFLHISTTFLAVCGYHANKIGRLLNQTFQRPNFRLLRRNRSAPQPMHVPPTKTNGSQKQPSLVNTAGGVTLPSRELLFLL